MSEAKGFDTSELTLDNIGMWPVIYKALALAFAFALVLALVYFTQIKELNGSLERLVSKESQLKQTYKKKAFDTANLPALKEQVAELEISFERLKNQLPKDTEVPGLLEDIDEVGRGSSVVMQAMELQPEVAQDYFVELPINVVADGGYHDFGSFVNGVAALPRIVTLHDFTIERLKDNTLLKLAIQAKTYRYKSEDE